MAGEELSATPTLVAINGLMNDEFRAQVVGRVLARLPQAPADLQRLFRSELSAVKVNGFRPGRAPDALLQGAVLRRMLLSDKVVGILLQIWMESHADLRGVVCQHLAERAISTPGIDFAANRFAGSWYNEGWIRERDEIVLSHSQFSEDDIALMLCCATGRMPHPEGDHLRKGGSPMQETFFPQWIDQLRALPADASQWEQAPAFVAALSEIIEAKEDERNRVAALNAAVAEIRDKFAAELAFFERDIDTWMAAHPQSQRQVQESMAHDTDAAELLSSLENLKSLLTAYRTLHQIAPVLSEERTRSRKRVALQKRILETFIHIDQWLARTQTPDDTTDDTALQPGEEGSARASEAARATTGRNPDDERPASTQENDPVPSTVDDSSLEAENQALRQEIETLHNQLQTSQNVVKVWRVAYETARKEVAQTGEAANDDQVLPIKDVKTAVAVAREKFADELLFQPNSKSEIEDNPYEKPGKVWAALEWLATTYYRSKMGEVNVPDFNSSILEACGWRYTGNQSPMTMNSFKPWYTTTVRDRIYWLKSHIGTGSNKDARHTIRIAFDWDKQRRVVVIGFIGQHQQTSAT